MNDNIKAGADIHAGDGGYSEGNKEDYEAFVKIRNQSLGKMRIKEFAEKAGLSEGVFTRHDGAPCNLTGYSMFPEQMQKFAELIVKECAETIQDFVDHRFPASEYPNRLKKYFGVEE